MYGWQPNTHKFLSASESMAYRSLKKAAAKRADVKALAAGDRASHLNAKQMLMDNANDGQIPYSYATPEEPDALLYGALLSDAQFEEVAEYDDRQLATPDIAVASFDAPAGFDATAGIAIWTVSN